MILVSGRGDDGFDGRGDGGSTAAVTKRNDVDHNISATNPLDQLAKALVTRFDTNQDGQLTAAEFTSLLAQFLGSSNALANGTKTGILDGTANANGLKNGTIAPRMLGFSADELADVNHTTIKYQFGRVAERYSLASVTDKASGEAVLRSMRDDLTAAGLDVLGIRITDDAG